MHEVRNQMDRTQFSLPADQATEKYMFVFIYVLQLFLGLDLKQACGVHQGGKARSRLPSLESRSRPGQ